MTLQDRDKRALVILGVAAVLLLGWNLSQPDETPTGEAVSGESIEMAEKRLQRLRKISAGLPAKEAVYKKVAAELQQREQGLMQADTAAQAQAQILQVVRRIGRAQAPPLEMRSNEVGQVRKYGDDYGEVSVVVSFDARIEQLVNFVSDLTAQKEILSTSELHVGQAHPKEKYMNVRMTISGLVRKQLIPEKKL